MRYGQGTDIGAVLVGENQLFSQRSKGIAGIALDYSGNIYVTDPERHIILKVNPSGEVYVFAGKSGVSGNNGNERVFSTEARFNGPMGINVDPSGNVVIADTGNNQIRKITPDGWVTLVAGDPKGTSGFV